MRESVQGRIKYENWMTYTYMYVTYQADLEKAESDVAEDRKVW